MFKLVLCIIKETSYTQGEKEKIKWDFEDSELGIPASQKVNLYDVIKFHIAFILKLKNKRYLKLCYIYATGLNEP